MSIIFCSIFQLVFNADFYFLLPGEGITWNRCGFAYICSCSNKFQRSLLRWRGWDSQRALLFHPPWPVILCGACGWRVLTWQLPLAETGAQCASPGSRSHPGHPSSVWSRGDLVLCCRAGWQCRPLTPKQLLLLSGSALALTLPAWGWSPFWVCARCRSPGSASHKHASAPCRQVSLCFPLSSHSFLTGWLGTVNFFFIFFLLLLLCKCSHLTAVDYWDL